MKPQGGRHQVNERRFIADFSLPKQPGAGNMTTAAMGFHAAPVIDALKDMLAIFANLEFDHY